ncbi:hypothetical protein [Jeotgalibacillus campisalis]|nr:hypothetical protein [Jeotgalibacillus campisalis]
MNKFLKITAGSLIAAALMVGCNMDDNARDDNTNESMMDDAVNETNNVLDRETEDMDMMEDKDQNSLNENIEENDNGIVDDEEGNREDMIEEKKDREDRDNRDE